MRCLSGIRCKHNPNSIHVLLLTLDLLLLLFTFASAAGRVLVNSDKYVLLEFKSSVIDPFGVLSSWKNKNDDHCSWVGVTCDQKSRVVSLNISGGGGGGAGGGGGKTQTCSKYLQFPLYGFGIRRNCVENEWKLKGKLSPLIGKLTELRVLSLPFNELSGEIPVEIWGLRNLQVLDLEGNSFNGVLSSQIGGLKSLRVLNLGFNEISGEIPGSLENCLGLEIINLAGNQVNGTVPRFIDKLSNLRGIYLSLNELGESIPKEIGTNCGSLVHLDLSGNFLVGEIPSSLGECKQLESLLLFANMLEDVIPPELGRLENLQVLDVSRNSLSGSIPADLGKCRELSVLILSNMFDPMGLLEYPRGGDSSFRLRAASEDDFNYFQGAIPVEITTLPKLKIIWAPRATIEGEIPRNWGACQNLEMVNLGQNLFTGGIPEVFGSCKNLHFLDLSSNRLTGMLNQNLTVPCMSVFDVSGNLLTGSIPIFSQGVCPPLPSLRAYGTQPFDPVSAYSSFFAYKSQTGSLFPSFGASGNFGIFHNFGGNNLTGSLLSLPIASERLGDLTAYAFLAGGNKLNGSFPEVLFEKCDALNGMIANVSDNQFSGPLPVEAGGMCRSLKLFDISGNSISGSVPQSFGYFESLVTLDLSRNKLYGPIPVSLGRLKDLQYLLLASNNLTGEIPSSLGQLYSLKVLDLSSNSLASEIPGDIANLKNLTVLLLNSNKLSGQIPAGLANVTKLSTFNVSFNNLSGPIPWSEDAMNCRSVRGNPFLQSCRLYALSKPTSDVQRRNGDLQNYVGPPPPPAMNKSRGFNSIEIASVASASAIVSVLLALVVLFLYTRKCVPKSRVGGSDRRREVTIFNDIGVPLSYENVVRGTGSFNASNCIGNGGFGATYKAEITPGFLVAIKRLSVGRFQGVQQFHAEIKTLGRMRHQNLVTLIGYHASEKEMFLIYNYLSGGNLENFIQERSERAVDWKTLHKIALDIARALAYLHDECVPRVLHRDVKPSNILLDNDYNAYLSDFGLARLLGTSETHATTGVAGTFGYVAPEYAMTCRVSDKADVYSYGVVLLELLSDKKALDPSFSSYGNGFNIVGWACMLLRQGRAKEFFTAGLWDSGPHDNLVETLHLAVMCTVDSLSIRPTMKQVVQRLKQLQHVRGVR
ncbi:hypothetical protein MKW98_004002 [Papaver atlanticum]|uniref:non-specific serine/threonine protein kinase n=1 Tax=Papaver atlanticum TaxID=357466 RepID=A0AAD4T0Z1_9MAGN|nr:hypothetical protein MKW98_004002 [Papaver atlanticum]